MRRAITLVAMLLVAFALGAVASAAGPTTTFVDLNGKRTVYRYPWEDGIISVEIVRRGLLLAREGNTPLSTARFWRNPIRWQIARMPDQGGGVFGKLYPVRTGARGERLTGRWIVVHDGRRIGYVEGSNPIPVALMELTSRYL